MTDYSKMSIDDLFAWRDQWPAQRTEWNRAELALQKRRAVRDAYLDLAEELRDVGLTLSRASSPLAQGTIWEGMSDAEIIAGTAYQVVGNLLTAEQFDTPPAQRALDWFADYNPELGLTEDLLPWSPAAPLPASPSSVEG